MKKGKRARRRKPSEKDAEEKLPDKPQRQSPASGLSEKREREELRCLRQKRLNQQKLFFFELSLLCCSFVFSAVVILKDYPMPLRLGAAATLWYIFREIIKHMTSTH